ncbi:MAG: hypothetical protein ACD_87C00096G0003 [uncultured bacterium]|nr:MAG: hypothetical protein ACD_87C00096G0003 [uncultured bacterium]
MKAPVFLTGNDDRFDCANTDIFNGGQSKTDILSRHAEIALRLIDIRRQDINPHLLAAADVADNLVPVILFAGQKRRHKLDRIMGFQIGGLV